MRNVRRWKKLCAAVLAAVCLAGTLNQGMFFVYADETETEAETVYSQEGVDYLGNVIAALKSMSPNLAVSYKPIPLHPGAERYFREIGLIKD